MNAPTIDHRRPILTIPAKIQAKEPALCGLINRCVLEVQAAEQMLAEPDGPDQTYEALTRHQFAKIKRSENLAMICEQMDHLLTYLAKGMD